MLPQSACCHGAEQRGSPNDFPEREKGGRAAEPLSRARERPRPDFRARKRPAGYFLTHQDPYYASYP